MTLPWQVYQKQVMKKVLLILFLLAQVTELRATMTTLELVDLCNVRQVKSEEQKLAEYIDGIRCLGFIKAIADSELLYDEQYAFCIHDYVTTGELKNLYLKRYARRPDLGHFPAVLTVITTFHKTFPCK